MNIYQKRKERQNKTEEVNTNKTNINWYPGHMVKTKREIKESLNLIDIVIELLDARVPISSRNPDIPELVGNKKRIIVLNKSDLANDKENEKWVKYYSSQGMKCVLVDSISGKGIKQVVDMVYELNKENAENDAKKRYSK